MRQFSPGNTEGWTKMRAIWTVALGPRSTGLGKMVQYPRDKFYVAKWGVFCHSAWLQISPARFKQVYSDKAIVIHHCQSDDFR